MKTLIAGTFALACLAGAAEAKIPVLNASCGPGIAVYSDGNGNVFIDGKQANVTKFNGNAYEAVRGHTTIDLTRNPDGTWSGAYTGKNGANGICTMAKSATGGATGGGGGGAKVTFFNATCGGGIEVHADDGGPVYINGKQANLNLVNRNYYEASRGPTTISVSKNPDGSLDVSYTGKNGANGICAVDGQDNGECPADVSEANRYMYPACN